MVKCDACGEDMTDECGVSVIGISLDFKMPKKSGKVHHEMCRVIEHFCKTEFNICYVCWLKSLGVKEMKDKV